MAAIREVSDDSQASGEPAGGCITPQNQPASVSQTIVDKKHQSCEEDEVICLHLLMIFALLFAAFFYYVIFFLDSSKIAIKC